MKNPINDSVFDTRDLIEYKEQLQSNLVDSYNDYIAELHEENDFNISDFSEVDLNNEGFSNRFEDEIEEYEKINSFCEELSDSADFEHGEAVINEKYFTEYTQDLLVDCGYIPKDMPSWIEIDYEATAENVKADYSEYIYDGETYYVRA